MSNFSRQQEVSAQSIAIRIFPSSIIPSLATCLLILPATSHSPRIQGAGPGTRAKCTELGQLPLPRVLKAGRQDKWRTLKPSDSKAW